MHPERLDNDQDVANVHCFLPWVRVPGTSALLCGPLSLLTHVLDSTNLTRGAASGLADSPLPCLEFKEKSAKTTTPCGEAWPREGLEGNGGGLENEA